MNDREALKKRMLETPVDNSDQGFMTSIEIAREMHWTVHRTTARLRELKAAGELEVRDMTRKNLADRDQVVPCYRLRIPPDLPEDQADPAEPEPAEDESD